VQQEGGHASVGLFFKPFGGRGDQRLHRSGAGHSWCSARKGGGMLAWRQVAHDWGWGQHNKVCAAQMQGAKGARRARGQGLCKHPVVCAWAHTGGARACCAAKMQGVTGVLRKACRGEAKLACSKLVWMGTDRMRCKRSGQRRRRALLVRS
jgi:hypothetical protein